MTYRARNIVIAVALAAVAALLTSFYVTNYKRHVQRGEDHVTVLVAKGHSRGHRRLRRLGSAVAARGTPQERRPRRDLQRRPAGRPRRDPADVGGRAGHDPPLQPAHARRRPGPADGHAARGLDRGRREPAARRHAQGRRPGRPRRGLQEARRPGHLAQPRPRARREGAQGARRACRRQQAHRRGEPDFNVMLALTDSQAQKLQYLLANAAARAPSAGTSSSAR